MNPTFDTHLPLAKKIAGAFKIPGFAEEDVLQEAAIALEKAVQTYSSEKGGFEPYANTVIRNHLKDLFNRQQLRTNQVLTLDEPLSLGDSGESDTAKHQVADPEVGPSREAERNEIRSLLAKCREQLSLPDQHILEMRMEGLTYEEIAFRTNVTPPAAHKKVKKALKTMKGNLAGYGIIQPHFLPGSGRSEYDCKPPFIPQPPQKQHAIPALIFALAIVLLLIALILWLAST